MAHWKYQKVSSEEGYLKLILRYKPDRSRTLYLISIYPSKAPMYTHRNVWWTVLQLFYLWWDHQIETSCRLYRIFQLEALYQSVHEWVIQLGLAWSSKSNWPSRWIGSSEGKKRITRLANFRSLYIQWTHIQPSYHSNWTETAIFLTDKVSFNPHLFNRPRINLLRLSSRPSRPCVICNVCMVWIQRLFTCDQQTDLSWRTPG